MLYLTSKTLKYLLHQTCQMLKFLTLSYSELLKTNINFLIPTHTYQVPLPFLTLCLFFLFFSSSNSTRHLFFLFFSSLDLTCYLATLPSSPALLPFPQPSCEKSKILFPLTKPNKLEEAKAAANDIWQSCWRCQSQNRQIFHLSLPFYHHGFVICGDCGLDCGFCGLWVVMEVVSCYVSSWVVFDGCSGLFHWVAVGYGLWWGCLGLLWWVVVVGCSGGW